MEFSKVNEARRSVNFFDSAKDVDEALIKQIYELAKLAPSSFNLQPWKLVLVHDAEWKARLREGANGQPKVTEAAYVAIVLGDKKAYEKMDPVIDENINRGLMQEQARDFMKGMAKGLYSGDNERAFAGRNAGLFAMSFMLAAQSLGVDTHPMDGINTEAIRKTFSIPDEYDIVMLIAIGRFDETKTLAPRASRKSFDEVVVREHF
ncbi:MAG: nitroreductase family protein [bacterium]